MDNNQIKSNQIKSNQIKSNQIKSNQIKTGQYILFFDRKYLTARDSGSGMQPGKMNRNDA